MGKWLILGLARKIYTVSLENLVMLEIKEVFGKKTPHKTNQNSSMIWVCQRNTEDNS